MDGGAEPIRNEGAARTVETVEGTGARAKYGGKALALSERHFQFAFSLATICLCLAVGADRDLIVRVKRTAGPFAQAVIRARHSQELNRAQNRECEEKQGPDCSKHDALPHKK